MEMIVKMVFDNQVYSIDLSEVSLGEVEELQEQYPFEVLGYR